MNVPRSCVLLVMMSLAGLAFASDEVQPITLGKDTRKDLALTVYSNFAVVHEVRETVLPRGVLSLEYQDVAKTVEPSSVMVEGARGRINILEQDYRYDLLNRDTLLKRYIGRKLKYSRNLFEDSHYEKVYREGVLLSTNPEIVKFGDEIEISPEGTISLAYIPESLTTTPTLVWRLENPVGGRQSIDTTYIADDISWSANYTLTLDEDKRQLDLGVWVTVDNRSGADYENAKLQLIAGNVRKIPGPGTPRPVAESNMSARALMTVPQQTFHEYHAYKIPRKTTLADKEKKQLHLASASGIDYEKSYLLESNSFVQPMTGTEQERFDVRIAFVNDRDNGLGMALPEGAARVYMSTDDGHAELIGEDMIKDTPEGERISLVTGKAFDLVAERKQTGFRRVGDRTTEVSYEITVRNRKKERVVVTVREHLFGDWEITQQNLQGKKIDSTTMDYKLGLDPGQERVVSYTARISR